MWSFVSTLLRCCPWPFTPSERRLERFLAESQSNQQQLQEQLSQQVSHALSSALTNRMDKVLREEMKKTVPQSEKTHTHAHTHIPGGREEVDCCNQRMVVLYHLLFVSWKELWSRSEQQHNYHHNHHLSPFICFFSLLHFWILDLLPESWRTQTPLTHKTPSARSHCYLNLPIV